MKRTLGLLVLSLVLIQTVTGCRFSEDRTAYTSTYMQPKSVYAVYRPSNETAWSYDIPPQHQLVVELDGTDGSMFNESKTLPTKLTWALYPIDPTMAFIHRERYLSSPIASGEVALNGSPIIIGHTVGAPIDPATLPSERSIEEIEQDLPEPDAPAADTADKDAPDKDADPLLKDLDLPEPDAK